MVNVRKRLNEFFVSGIWDVDISSIDRFRALPIKFLRLLYVAVREFSEGQLILRAMGLTYTTLLSLVPLLAISFSVLKAFGVHNQIEPLIGNFLAPLGPEVEKEVAGRIIGFVENVNVGVLGSVGLAILIYTSISVVQKTENAFNYIWKVKKPRSLSRRFSDYISLILIGPVLIFFALGITASIKSTALAQRLASVEPFKTAVYSLGRLTPYIFVCVAFTFIYIFMPNMKVRFSSAFVGGLFGGVMWETTGWVLASFVISSTRYASIYSGFAIIIIFMIWIYVSWLILLVGSEISFYYQYPQFLNIKKEKLLLSCRLKEKVSFLIMFLISYNYYNNKHPWKLDSLVDRLGLPVEPVLDVITVLEDKGLILETGDDPPAYLPSRDIGTITLKEFLNSVRTAGEGSHSTDEKFLSISEVDGVMKSIDGAIGDLLEGRTIKDLVLSRNSEEN